MWDRDGLKYSLSIRHCVTVGKFPIFSEPHFSSLGVVGIY